MLQMKMLRSTFAQVRSRSSSSRSCFSSEAKVAIWERNPRAVKKEEYSSFFLRSLNETAQPIGYLHTHFAREEVQYKSILYVPAPSKVTTSQLSSFVDGAMLELPFPRYLGFVKGVVHVHEQSDLNLDILRKCLVSDSLHLISVIASSRNEDYMRFWNSYGNEFSLGLLEDLGNQNSIAALLRFSSSQSQHLVSLDDYLLKMDAQQDSIFYLPAAKIAKYESLLSKFSMRNLEVLYTVQPLGIKSFKNKTFTQINKEAVGEGWLENALKKLMGMIMDSTVKQCLTSLAALIGSGSFLVWFNNKGKEAPESLSKRAVKVCLLFAVCWLLIYAFSNSQAFIIFLKDGEDFDMPSGMQGLEEEVNDSTKAEVSTDSNSTKAEASTDSDSTKAEASKPKDSDSK